MDINLPKTPLLTQVTLTKDPKAWNSIIRYHAKLKNDQAILKSFAAMEASGSPVNNSTLPLVLKACARLQAVKLGKKIHSDIQNTPLIKDVRVQTAFIDFYCKCGFFYYARRLFDEMTRRDLVSWNALISGYVGNSQYEDAIALFFRMRKENLEPNSITLVSLLSACAEMLELRLGQEIHCYCLRNGLFDLSVHVGTSLIGFYSRFDVRVSRWVFDSMVLKNLVSWNAMISGYCNAGEASEALKLFVQMLVIGIAPCSLTMLVLVQSCADLGYLKVGKQVHQFSIKSGLSSDIFIGSALIDLYAKVRSLESSSDVFENMPARDVASWNAMMHAYKDFGCYEKALDLFNRMQLEDMRGDVITFATMLSICAQCSSLRQACKNQASLKTGQSIHSHAIRHGKEFNSSLHTALTDMYMDCGDEKTARCLFERSSDRDLISWNAMVACYVRSGRPNEALLLFQQMQSEVKPNLVTMINTLPSIAHLANLPQGRCMHAYIIRNFPLHLDVAPGNALLTMYAKCGSIHDAERVLQCLPRRDIVSYNAMIAGYGMHGRGKDALRVFSEMQEAGLRPTSVTFVSVLSACSHSGLVEKGQQLFQSMSWHYNVVPEIVHYACMVDLFGRAGLLDEARNFIDLMPMEPDASVWRALLGACRNFSNIELARVVSEKLIELEPMNIGNYILLSNIYAAAGNWDIVRKLRMQITEQGLRKAPGSSWVVIKTKVHCFVAGDRLHPQTDEIYSKLSCLMARVTEAGYVPDSSWVLHDLEDEEKDQRLFSHSEKLAISFGLLNVISGAPILVTKNLRVCGDCHTFIKLVSKVVGREIVLRDASRFHHFVDGICSCKDYW
ncbi:pentatricopeptide repeat-containing protein At3g26782, mitochondrial-like isoform X2 [Magnolia sinica]|uniref:pentatricopeptide repeat-containing protein At3g26782, mitochondrial-like isoform X2 n=1 Tax=Magnolia sinica TaxID=86752 RepID=UPI0026582CE2|nr:pentatricopeptide repeat-containing protein At3g26782, mitochondrial-like isoform X2 [Magnolia sinica]